MTTNNTSASASTSTPKNCLTIEESNAILSAVTQLRTALGDAFADYQPKVTDTGSSNEIGADDVASLLDELDLPESGSRFEEAVIDIVNDNSFDEDQVRDVVNDEISDGEFVNEDSVQSLIEDEVDSKLSRVSDDFVSRDEVDTIVESAIGGNSEIDDLKEELEVLKSQLADVRGVLYNTISAAAAFASITVGEPTEEDGDECDTGDGETLEQALAPSCDDIILG